MKKACFFDADGTLMDLRTGIPDDIAPALTRLVENGHLAFLCTGRGLCIVTPDIRALPFSGMITGMGAYIEYEGRPLLQTEADPKEAQKALAVVRDCGFIPVLEGDRYMYYDTEEYTNAIDWFAELITNWLGENRLPITGNEHHLHINKICAKRMPGCREEELCRRLAHQFEAVRHEGGICGRTVEMVVKGRSKGQAIRDVCRMLEIDPADTFAFGDSFNDLSMLQAAHVGVAMGNAPEGLKAAADYVTATLEEGGVPKALKHYGLI